MKLHEGRLIARTLIQHVETTATTTRDLMDLRHFLKDHLHHLNRCVLFVSAVVDTSSNYMAGDVYKLYIKVYGMMLSRELTSVHLKDNTMVSEIAFPLCTIGIPSTSTDLVLKGKFANWSVTETHRILLEVHAYLLEMGPDQLTVKSY